MITVVQRHQEKHPEGLRMAHKIFKSFLTIFIVLAAALFSTSSPCWASSVKIGVFLPLSGQSSAPGQSILQGIKVAHTLHPTVLNRTVELVTVDTMSDRMKAANAVERLIKSDHVRAIIGEATTNGTLAGAAIADWSKIPMISPATTSPSITRNRTYVFRTCFNDTLQGEAAAAYVYETLGARKAAVMLDIAQDYSIGLANAFERAFMNRGGSIVSHTYCQTWDQDFTTQLQAVMAAKPDVLYMPNYYQEVSETCRQAKKLGLNISMISGNAVQTNELLERGASDVDGLIFTGHFDTSLADTAMAKQYLNRFSAATGQEANPYAVLGADAYFVLIDAIERAKSLRPYKIRQALAHTDGFQGVSGGITIGNDGNAIKNIVFMQVKDGTFRHLTTVNPGKETQTATSGNSDTAGSKHQDTRAGKN
jgi:branched-chain amino acid transport system substrate-binding protein